MGQADLFFDPSLAPDPAFIAMLQELRGEYILPFMVLFQIISRLPTDCKRANLRVRDDIFDWGPNGENKTMTTAFHTRLRSSCHGHLQECDFAYVSDKL